MSTSTPDTPATSESATRRPAVHRLNHAVLFITDVARSVQFYRDVLGFEVVHKMGDRAAFLRADGSANDHDLGLFALGADAEPKNPRAVGLYHLAWQVDTLEELVALQRELVRVGSLVGSSNHGVSRSLYATDPDGNEFEVMWAAPRASWPESIPGVQPLDLEEDLRRFSGVATLHEMTSAGLSEAQP